jgi:carboxypeptidase T
VQRRVVIFVRLLLLIALTAGLAGTSPASAGQSTPASPVPVLTKVYFHSEGELNQLAAHLDVWEVHRPEGYVLARLTPAQLSDLKDAGWQVEIVSYPALPAASGTVTPQSGGIPGFPCYRTLDETYARMKALALQYPALAQVASIGASWEKVTSGGTGGSDILLLKLTNSAHPGPKPVFFLMAEIHARELVTAETALRFAEYLLQNYGVDPDVTWLLDYFEVQIVPMANPDGRKMVEADLSTYWRKNTDNANGCTILPDYGTDLNRNFNIDWGGGGASSNACDETYDGPSAASEPEVQALQDYLSALFAGGSPPSNTRPAPADKAGLLISLHSYGSLVLWPYGTTSQPAPNQVQLQTLGRKLAYFNGYNPMQSYDLYQTSGTTDDWLYGTQGVASYTMEMGDNFYEDCSAYETTIWPDNRATLLYAFKSARLPYQTPAGPDVTSASVPAAVPAGLSEVFTATADDTRSSTANGSQPLRSIQAARASLDAPSWKSGAVTFSVSPADGAFDSSVESLAGSLDTSGLKPGQHTLFIEAQDSAGDWGAPTAVFLDIVAPVFQVDVTPAASLIRSLPGRQLHFNLTLTNQGNLPDSFDLSATNSLAWTTTVDPPIAGPLQPGASTFISVTVDIPLTAPAGKTSLTQLTVHSQAQPSTSKTVSLWARVVRGYYLALVKN